jgi:hypothetical protein
MDVTPFFITILPIVTVLAVGALGSSSRLGFWPAVLLAIVLTPVGGTLAALISGRKRIAPRPISKRTNKRA